MPKHYCRIIMNVVFEVTTCKKLFSRIAHRQELALSTRCGRKDCRKQPVLFVIFMRLMHALCKTLCTPLYLMPVLNTLLNYCALLLVESVETKVLATLITQCRQTDLH